MEETKSETTEETKTELPRYADRIAMWVKDHKPHQKLPLVPKDNELIWLNRAARRKLKLK